MLLGFLGSILKCYREWKILGDITFQAIYDDFKSDEDELVPDNQYPRPEHDLGEDLRGKKQQSNLDVIELEEIGTAH